MARSNRETRRRRPLDPRSPGRGSLGRSGLGPRPAASGWALAAVALLVLGGLLLLFNQQHSGDALKIRRELRKF
ncbi:MAG: hypothetical protein ACK5N0_12745 [Synechococcaceae cyanobacterium]